MPVDQDKIQSGVMDVLKYIDSPFKLGVVIALAVLGFSGFFIYQNQGTFIEAYKKKSSLPTVEYSKADDVSQMLFKSTGADIVALLAVDTLSGKRTVMRIYTKEAGRYKDLDGMKIPLFTTNKQSNQDTIRLFAGEITEGPVHAPTSQLGYFYHSQGITYQAKASIPPDPNLFVAMITVSWKVKPENPNLNMLAVAAEMLTSKE